MPVVDINQIEVARDAWLEDEGVGERWFEGLVRDGVPGPIINYIRKRFEKERADLQIAETDSYRQKRHRITSLRYEPDGGLWSVTDNTPGE